MFSDKDLIFRAPDRSVLDFAAGGFARHVLILSVAEPAFPGNRSFLTKILAASRLNLEQDTLFAEIPAGMPVTVLPAIRQKQAGHILVFGLPALQIGVVAAFPLYQPQIFYGTTFLFADALSILEPDKNRKGQLWQALQQLFP